MCPLASTQNQRVSSRRTHKAAPLRPSRHEAVAKTGFIITSSRHSSTASPQGEINDLIYLSAGIPSNILHLRQSSATVKSPPTLGCMYEGSAVGPPPGQESCNPEASTLLGITSVDSYMHSLDGLSIGGGSSSGTRACN